ncbi:MAG: hypothetical protein AAF847_07085 [Bacteroidota bacterium]
MVVQEISYANFMANPIVYDAMQMLWYDLLNSLALEHDFAYKPYLNSLLANGEKERDANPIFNTYIQEPSRAVRIIQIPEEEKQATHIQAYLNVSGDEEYDEEIIDELVIHLVYSETARILTKNWMKAWLVDGMEKEEMEVLLEEQSLLLEEEA